VDGREPAAVIQPLIWRRAEGRNHGPGQDWQEYSEVLQQDIDALEASIQRAREYICVDICKGEIGGGEDAVGNLIAICNGIRAQRDELKPMAALGEQLLARAKQSCTDESIDEWAQETLELAEKLGQVGGVRQEIYDPAKHGSIDAVAGEDLIWTWDTDQPRVDSPTPPGESAS
jgi:hypothetical protein